VQVSGNWHDTNGDRRMRGVLGRQGGTSALRLSYAAVPASAPRMRAALDPFLSEHGVSRVLACDVVHAAQEALINAIMHAGDAAGRISVSASVRRGTVTVVVRDAGRGFDPRTADSERLPDLDKVRGRGLFLMHQLMDQVEVRSGRHGTQVRMVRSLHGDGRPRPRGWLRMRGLVRRGRRGVAERPMTALR
jgi:anti-sigma regulatory factor (Ser/Thr protein kinase)